MKKIMQLAVMITVSLLLQGNTLTPRSSTSSTVNATTGKASSVMLSYTWYYDMFQSDPVGTILSVNDELNRLRWNYGGIFSFSSLPDIGLVPYEYGRFAYYQVIIYSNLPLYW